jgi:hypothetical protein
MFHLADGRSHTVAEVIGGEGHRVYPFGCFGSVAKVFEHVQVYLLFGANWYGDRCL